MIVCWVLFSGLTVATAFVWFQHEQAENEYSSVLNQLDEQSSDEYRPPEVSNHLRYLSDQMSNYASMVGSLGAAAASLLLWSILCHTAHWIWQGRKVD